MKRRKLLLLNITRVLIFVCFHLAAHAQKAPKVQEESVRAPAKIKIDGISSEWTDNKLNAFNDVCRLWYTISNDDDYLYLTARAPYFLPSEKILMGGLTFTIAKSFNKKNQDNVKESVSLTFPVAPFEKGKLLAGTIGKYQDIMHDTINNQQKHDDLVKLVKSQTIDVMKEIKVEGIKETPGDLISVYNNFDIKAMGAFNRGMSLTVEIAIPLKYLGLSTKDGSKFGYNIKLNVGMPVPNIGESVAITTVQAAQAAANADYLYKPTDFWGEYALAKQ